ncbi:hypothetical protein ACFPM3_03245 [Streptomyces coeruleoprunus]|uniref:Ig-like domain-containing protein n=1 Tax=Streptomyces coeruleoprunus TaxID=285563 RepID=A0ABV9X6R8_9ACTN
MNRPSDDPDYSATELASHWIQRPQPQDPDPDAAPRPSHDGATILRFGPGVTAVLASGHVPAATTAPPTHPKERQLRAAAQRYTLPAVVLLCVLAFLLWQRLGPAVAVRDVTVRTDAAGPGCDGTAEVVGVVTTNGRPGTLTYRWLRSDGSASAVLSERVRRGQRQATLRLLWTFSGEGAYPARARLDVLTPARHRAEASFTYACPGVR